MASQVDSNFYLLFVYAMRHVFVRPYNPPFPDPRKWGQLTVDQNTNGWMQAHCYAQQPSTNNKIQNEEEREGMNLVNDKDLNVEWELELNDEWAERFATTLEKMKKRRRDRLSESKDEDDDASKGKKRKTNRKKNRSRQ